MDLILLCCREFDIFSVWFWTEMIKNKFCLFMNSFRYQRNYICASKLREWILETFKLIHKFFGNSIIDHFTNIVVQKWVWVKLSQYVIHDRKNKCGLKGLRAENTKNFKNNKIISNINYFWSFPSKTKR